MKTPAALETPGAKFSHARKVAELLAKTIQAESPASVKTKAPAAGKPELKFWDQMRSTASQVAALNALSLSQITLSDR